MAKVKVIGGVSDKQWGKQFKQQYRVLDKKQCSYAINTAGFNGLTIKKCSELNKQQQKDISN